MPILKAVDVYGAPGAVACVDRARAKGVPVPHPAAGPPAGEPLPAVVNHGRWLVECEVCHSAQVIDPADRRFYCIRCHNLAADHHWRPVIWPAGWAQIEQVLLARPLVANRNWAPPETLQNLQADNAAHELPPAVTP